jgi:hypothetical protein
MMCFGGGGGGSQQQAPTGQQTPNVPTSVDPVVQQARSAAVRKNRIASGSRSTILTRGSVVAAQRAALSGTGGTLNNAALGAPAANKTLLGQ